MSPRAAHVNPLVPLHDAALDCLDRGWSPIPLHPRSKKPSLPWQAFQTRHAAPAEVRSWPADANLAVVTGAISGLVVVDVDGPEGQEAFTALCAGELPNTPTVKTGKGLHLHFKHPGILVSNRTNLLPKVDIRGDGGSAVLPPSIHENGTKYEWLVSPDEVPLAPLPEWVLSLPVTPITSSGLFGGSSAVVQYSGRPIPEGCRNDSLYRFTRSLRHRMSEGDVRAAVHAANQEWCRPPLSHGEVNRIVDHALTQPDRPMNRLGVGR